MDLQLDVEMPLLVVPSNPTDILSTLHLHNVDQQLFFHVEMVFFYTATPDSTEDVIGSMYNALRELLVPYHFAAGRFNVNEEEGRLEILCNRAGALFTGACSGLSISQLGDITAPNPSFRNLLLYPRNVEAIPDIPLLTVQVTKFACGGFTVGFCVSHALFDGIGLNKLFSDYASIVRGKGIELEPNVERAFLKARNPPLVSFKHEELTSFPDVPAKFLFNPTEYDYSIDPTPPGFCYKTFAFTPRMLNSLKRQVMISSDITACSGFEALAGLIWQAKIKALDLPPAECPNLFVVMDARKILRDSLPKEGFMVGNTIIAAPCSNVTCAGIRENPLSFSVKNVQKTIHGMNEEYIRSHMDWCELNHGIIDLPGGTLITTWSKLGFDHVDFGWGKPQYVAPVVHSRAEYIIIVPNCLGNGGVNVFMAMQVEKMNEFEKLLFTDIYN